MPQKSDAELTTEAQVIRDETTELANTKTRVYDILKNIIDSKPNNTAVGGGAWGTITGTLSDQTDLDSALDAIASAISNHMADTSDAHDASAISNVPAGAISSTDVQAAINELDTAIALKLNAQATYRTLTADHTLDSTDLMSINAGESLIIEENQAIANDVTIPEDLTIDVPIGKGLFIMQTGAGLTSIIAGAIAAGGFVTINSSAGHLNSPGQYSPMFLLKKAANNWYLFNGLPSSVAVPQDWGASLTPAGFSSVSVQRSYYQDDGHVVSVYVEISGTSNATTFQFSLPIALDATIYTTNSFMIVAFIQNVGAGASGRIYASGSGTLVTVDATVAGGAFTNSGTKALKAHLFYFK